jgi:DNA-binding GntR family transcriptional regulator
VKIETSKTVSPGKRKRRSTSFDVERVTPLDRAGEDPVVTDLVHRHLREAILEGVIPAGGIISQVKLSQHLGVSRTPLREAIRRLEQEQLVEASPNRRARVRSFDARDLEFVYANRVLLEALALAVSAPALTQEDLASISQSLADMQASVDCDDYGGWEAAHRRFHRGLIAKAPGQLRDSIESYAARGVLAADRQLYDIAVGIGFKTGAKEHEAIFAACRARDAWLASALLARHLSVTALAVLTQVMPEHDPASIRAALRLAAGPDAPLATAGRP